VFVQIQHEPANASTTPGKFYQMEPFLMIMPLSVQNIASSASAPSPRSEPVLCVKGCGFYGNPNSADMCSKCYKDAARAGEIVVPPVQLAVSTPFVGQAESKAVSEDSANPKKSKKNRCAVCKIKVSPLTYFTCRCDSDLMFCAAHRLPDEHNCSFDRRKANMARLNTLNPVVAHSKLDKI